MTSLADTVIKIGGGLLAAPAALDRVAQTLRGACVTDRRLLVVPGGGPFADAVRDVDSTMSLDASAAHWMAILGMDQYAHLLASRLPHARLTERLDELASIHEAGALPVFAPYRLLRAVDPLPHGWNVTSDSIAAWISRHIGAARLILIKPSGAIASDAVVDSCFHRLVDGQLRVSIIDPDTLSAALANN
ncbi:MAG: hypothetical protein ACREOJ_11890 [Gemmatimonadaceae bacterium]